MDAPVVHGEGDFDRLNLCPQHTVAKALAQPTAHNGGTATAFGLIGFID